MNEIEWHDLIQDIFREYLSMMSGKIIQEASKEYPSYFQADYYCLVKGELSDKDKKNIVRPFDHLKERNIIEYKSGYESLNEATFRQYVGRALLLENPDRGLSYQGKMTLTILTTMKPEMFTKTAYRIEPINKWKYISRWIENLDIYILVQKEMRGEKAGEALALLQVLESKKEKQAQHWTNLLNQNLENAEVIKKIMQKISKEAYMNFVAQAKTEELIKVLSWVSPNVLKKYENNLKKIKTVEELEAIEEKIRQEIQGQKK